MLELKANRALAPFDKVQLVNYLTAILTNIGGERLEFKRKSRTYRPKALPKDFILSILFILSKRASVSLITLLLTG